MIINNKIIWKKNHVHEKITKHPDKNEYARLGTTSIL